MGEGKSLGKGRGKNKGRSQAVRATGARGKRVKATRKDNRTGSGRTAVNRTISSELHWYDDDQVVVYDPVDQTESVYTLGSRAFKELYDKIRKSGAADETFLKNERTGEVYNFYGTHPEYSDVEDCDSESDAYATEEDDRDEEA